MANARTYEKRCNYPDCAGSSMKVHVNPEGSRHWGKAICTSCGRWNAHLPNPTKIRQNDGRDTAILSFKYAMDNLAHPQRKKLILVERS